MSPRVPFPVPRRLALAVTVGVASLLAGGVASAQHPGGYPEEVIQWGVQPGTTCEDIARALYGDARHAGLLRRYNRVVCTRGAPLKPGITLVLPAKVTTVPTARIDSLKPDVRARAAGAGWSPASAGTPLSSNSSVNSLENASASIGFIDRTRVVIAENTLIIVYGTASQTAVSKALPPAVEVQEGEVKAALAALRGDAVEVAVPGGGRISAASRDTIIERKGERTTVAVFDGSAAVTNAGASVNVPLNHGTRFVGVAPPQKPRPLPPAPTWSDADTPAVVLGTAGGGALTAGWQSVPAAKAYRVEVSRDDRFDVLELRQEVPATVTRFRGENFPVGSYYLRVRAIDQDDFLGVAAAPRRLALVAVQWRAGSGTLEGDELVTNPYGALELTVPPGAELGVGDGPFGPVPAALDLRGDRPARLRLRLGGVEKVVTVRYADVRAHIEPEGQPPSHYRITLEGAEGVDPSRIDPHARVQRVGVTEEMPLERLSAEPGLVYRLAAVDGLERVVVVDGTGVTLGSHRPTARGEEPAVGPAPAEPEHLPQVGPSAPRSSLGVLGAPLAWSARGTSMAALSVVLGGDFSPDDEHDVDFQGRLSATGALGPVTIEATIYTDALGDAGAGDASGWLGLRDLAFRDEELHLELGPALRFAFPVSDTSPPGRAELGFAVGGDAAPWTWLVDVGSRLQLEDEVAGPASMPIFGVVAATVDLLEWLRAHATVDLMLVRPGDVFRAGGGLSLGLEAGTTFFGSVSGRGAPFAAPLGGLSAELTVGIREAP